MPFVLQEVWPVPLFIAAYFAPESPWNAVRRGQIEEARQSLMRLSQDTPNKEHEVDATLAYIKVRCRHLMARQLGSHDIPVHNRHGEG
jgi:SP family general alpha glucoside:H+ symporter-like MFS transporter